MPKRQNVSENYDKKTQNSLHLQYSIVCVRLKPFLPRHSYKTLTNDVLSKSLSVTVVCLNIWRGKILLCKILLQCAA